MKKSPDENAILSAWTQTLARFGDAPAVYAPDGRLLRTFQGVEEEARKLEPLFQSFEKGQVVAIQIGNSPSWPAALLAVFRRGLVALPLGRHMAQVELESALATCRAAALVHAEGERLVVAGRETGSSDWDAPAPDLLKLTSGTTGAPRAVRFRAHQLVADCDNICATMGFDHRDLNFGVIPFSHSYGFSNLVTPLVCRGVPLVASEDRMPRAILDGLAASGATVFPGMPVFYDKLAGLENVPPLPKLRLCISAGAPLTRNVAEPFTRKFGLKVHTFYGSSECGGIGYDASPEPMYEDGYVGAPMQGVEIRGERSDEPGRIAIYGPNVGDGYFPEKDDEALGLGRFIPGDLVRWTERGMFMAGRASDVINIAGRKLNPGEVEVRIAGFSGVRQVVVFGVPSTLRGEEPVACVAGEAIDVEALKRFCLEQLSQWQMPRDFWVLPEIPSNERGKTSRRSLAEQYLASKSAQ